MQVVKVGASTNRGTCTLRLNSLSNLSYYGSEYRECNPLVFLPLFFNIDLWPRLLVISVCYDLIDEDTAIETGLRHRFRFIKDERTRERRLRPSPDLLVRYKFPFSSK